MTRTILTPRAAMANYPTLPPVEADFVFTYVAGDVANGNRFLWTGHETLIAINSSLDTQFDITLKSAPNSKGRSGSQADLLVSMEFGESFRFQPFKQDGWKQTDGYVWVDVENAAILLAVLKSPL